MPSRKTKSKKNKSASAKHESDDAQIPLENQEYNHEMELRGKVHTIYVGILSLVNQLAKISILVFWLAFMIIFGVILYHFILPEPCHWLKEVDIAKLQSIIFSGTIGGVITLAIQRVVARLN